MNTRFKHLIKKILPKKIISKISEVYLYYSFRGNYRNFHEVEKIATSYDNEKLLTRIKDAYYNSLKYNSANDRDGEVVFARDSNFKVLRYLNQFSKNEKSIVIDFGGSILNFQRQYKKFINNNIKWFVVDNKKICKLGKELKIKANFFDDLEKALISIKKSELKYTTILFGSVLQYIPNFVEIIKLCNKYNINKIIIHRQPMLKNNDKIISVQHIPFWVSRGKYAVCLYGERKIINFFLKYDYKLIESFKSLGLPFKKGSYKSLIFTK